MTTETFPEDSYGIIVAERKFVDNYTIIWEFSRVDVHTIELGVLSVHTGFSCNLLESPQQTD